jgi:transposase InsO family protein
LGKRYFQFTAIDCFTRIKFAKCYTSLSSKTAKLFLFEAQQYFPFLIQNIQTDNGSEFLKYFHQALKEITHYFSYPHCPKDNCFVERVIQTDKYEFYLNGNLYTEIALQNEKLARWNYIYNYPRPHQALGNLSPMEYYEKIKARFPKSQKTYPNQQLLVIVNEPQKVYGML